MIQKTPFSAAIEDIDEALNLIQSRDFEKTTITQPTGHFFYDPWEIKSEFKNTALDRILKTLKIPYGEARIITLPSKTNYVSHSDIDDRYHLNLSGVYSYLVDIDNEKMFPLEKDGIWYEMDTSRLHSAVNFGNRYRHQLVVRKLLLKSLITNLVHIRIESNIDDQDEARFIFDHKISSTLNLASKAGKINDFILTANGPEIKCDINFLDEIKNKLPNELKLVIL